MIYTTKIEIAVYLALFFSLYFGVLMFLIFFEKRKLLYFKAEKQKFPLVSMLVPCFNEENNIENVLNSLLNLDYPQSQLEIIVIDDGSTDKTLQKAHLFTETHPNIKVLHKENGGKYTALNLGIKHSCGNIIGCIDADCTAQKNSLKKMVNYFCDQATQAVVSSIKITNPKGLLLNVQHSEFLVSAFLKKMFSFLGSITVTPGPLSLFRKTALVKLGPYKEAHLTEDLEMALRMQSQHLKIEHALDAVVYTKGQKSLKKLCYQRLRWRRGFLLNLNDYKKLLNVREHGNLSLMIAYNFFGAFITVGITAYTTFRLVNYLIQQLTQAILINFEILPYLTLSWPRLSIKPALLLGSLSLGLILAFMALGKKYTYDKLKLTQKAIFYLIAYSFLSAFWWLTAGFSILFKKKLNW